ncbi:MAG: CYTH domain-containing protein [Gammaproteobacteria bacterium]|jgi:adenylate cyclase|nr:CYTH domain-containing protein [Gammaproteobacteria bacterium]
MGIEIERKFLLLDDSWRTYVNGQTKIVQGYLATTESSSIRVRIQGEVANLNIKSMTIGVSRAEFEYPIPIADAEDILANLCKRPKIEKTRHYIKQDTHTWEIDVFEGDNRGLIVAEIELTAINEEFKRPAWLGQEVSDDERYYNVSLVKYPFKDW